jgi:hypothetical protein
MLVLGVLAALIASGAIATKARAVNPLGPDMFGISTGGTIQNQDVTTLGRDLDTMAAVGARWVRIDINWAQVQAGGPSSYNWAPIDRVVQGANARGLKVLGIIAYTPGWARPSGTSSKYGPDPATYAAFAAEAVEHYSAMGVHAYEVWNEPNIVGFWQPKPSPSAYTQLLRAAYPAIKAADPQATVLTGGTSPAVSDGTNVAPVAFVQGIYANGGRGYFDAVSHHPYTWPAFPGDTQAWNPWYQMTGANPSIRSVMGANGDSAKKVWATEYGAPTNGPSSSSPVSEATQAEMITRAYALWETYDWAGPLFVYQHRDQGTSTSTRENFFGLVRTDYSQKPAYAAYQSAVNNLGSGGGGGGGTTVDVNGKGRGKGHGKVKGAVLTKSATRVGGTRASFHGRLHVKLARKSGGRWRAATGWKPVRLAPSGRFKRSLRNLRAGRYRAQARYVGPQAAKPLIARSPSFRVRS